MVVKVLDEAASAEKFNSKSLCGNLQVDISKTCDLLGWTPPVSVDAALRQTAQAYLQARR